MKKPVNFRLNPQTVATLTLLSDKEKKSRTEIVENAIEIYSKEQSQKRNRLLQFAGSISNETADDLLKTIYSNRVNKEIPVYL